jgi:KDO2-lipid IV(A) lauroyltransferase
MTAREMKREAVYLVGRVFIWLGNALPRGLAVFVGGWLGLAAWKLLPRDQHKVHRHLSLVYGGRLTVGQRENIGRTVYINFGRNLTDLVRMRRHFATEIRPCISTEGLNHFQTAYDRGRGLIGVTGHIGNFELLAAYIASLGYRIAVIGRELQDARLDRFLVDNRRMMGLTNIATTDSPRKALSWLKSGGAIGVLIDTDSARVRSMFIPAFGRLSNTAVGQTIIGLRTGAAFLPMACLRLPDNRYRIVIRPPVEATPSGDFERDVYEVTLKCTRALEEIIDAHRDQWIWLHNRWRTSAPFTS